ncbi:4-hydroxyphenylpyruvate dioxygenase [Streptomyces sp. NPDC017202]|uniref:4-hydroxyphenylpyruvate dioxygenase n=1 Tax=Streptomyces sp. NPDC017202 TaxID=3364981 RepID=UPI0037A0CB5F
MTDSFDDEHAMFSVLVDAEGRHSLWPAGAEVPKGWSVARPAGTRATALAHVGEHWRDLRPRTLVRRLRTFEETTMSGPTRAAAAALSDVGLDHVRFHVSDLAGTTDWLARGYGLSVYARSDGEGEASGARSVALGRRDVRLLLSRPVAGTHPGAEYVDKHGDGVADIALSVPDAVAAFAEAVRRGARPVSAPTAHGDLVTATIAGVGDISHTFVQRVAGGDERALPGLCPVEDDGTAVDCGLREIDHFAIAVEPGDMDATVEFYRTVLDFELIFTERIEVDDQVMITKVVESRSGAVTFTLVTPDPARATGHLHEFLKSHNGPGVQHIAFATNDIVRSVDSLVSRGVDFLPTPSAYYRALPDRLTPLRHSVAELERLNILIDEDHDGQLFQIFTRSVHPRGTLFLEVIERMGARSFGSGNIRALYQAVEHEQGRGGGNAT